MLGLPRSHECSPSLLPLALIAPTLRPEGGQAGVWYPEKALRYLSALFLAVQQVGRYGIVTGDPNVVRGAHKHDEGSRRT